MTDLTITAEPRRTLSIALVGRPYSLKPPKGALAISLAVEAQKALAEDPSAALGLIDKWMDQAFDKKTVAAIQKRLADPEDDLDIQHISLLMQKVVELQTGDPTT